VSVPDAVVARPPHRAVAAERFILCCMFKYTGLCVSVWVYFSQV